MRLNPRLFIILGILGKMQGCMSGVYSDPYCNADAPFKNGDDCCPPGATAEQDSDCSTVCGDTKCGEDESFATCPQDCYPPGDELWREADSPITKSLFAVWMMDSGDGWAVGQTGVILRYTGGKWLASDSPTLADLHDVWADGPNDAWAVGDLGALIHWTGGQWEMVDGVIPFDRLGEERLNGISVSGTSDQDAWILPEGATTVDSQREHVVLHWNGSTWRTDILPESGDGQKVFAKSAQEAWILAGDRIFQWKGQSWQEVPLEMSGDLQLEDLWGDRENELWVAGIYITPDTILNMGIVLFWDGSQWQEKTADGMNSLSPQAIWGLGSTVWVAGLMGEIVRGNGDGWQPERAMQLVGIGSAIWSIGGDSLENLWAVGDGGLILRRKE